MTRETSRDAIRRAAQIVADDHDRLLQLWGRRGSWQIQIRWAVAPLMVLGLLVARQLGFEIAPVPILSIAAAVLLYNLVFVGLSSYLAPELERSLRLGKLLTVVGMIADYAALLTLLQFTGGVSSPLLVFMIFHVIIAAIQFSTWFAYRIAAVAAAGLWILLLGQIDGWFRAGELVFRGEPVHALDRPLYQTVLLAGFTATLFLVVAMVGRIMRRLRERVGELARTTTELGATRDKLESLYAMVCAIGAERRLEPVLQTVVSELARVMSVPAVSIKLLSEDARTLRYVAACGLPGELTRDTVLRLEDSPINRRVIAGETLVHGKVGDGDSLQLEQELTKLGIRSAILTPLRIEDRVIGALGLYAPEANFEAEAGFLQLAAGLIAIAIEDTRANEAIERMAEERTGFMLRTAHNLRAPLGAGLSMLDLIEGGYAGPLSDRLRTALGKIEQRLQVLHRMIGEILTIAQARDWSREIPDVVVDLARLAERTRDEFQPQAERKRIDFKVSLDDDLPAVDSGADLLEQVMQNLVSNAIKYTPEGGRVTVAFRRLDEDHVRIQVEDSGIGIPADEQHKLFEEFFRASNAKKLTPAGTGLGLALVKQTVERHRGQIRLASEVDRGTTVVIDLPFSQTRATIAAGDS